MQEVHPLIRVGGPILGAILLIYVIVAMVGQFQADQAAAVFTPLPIAGVEEPAEEALGEGVIEPEPEQPAEVPDPEVFEVTPDVEEAEESEEVEAPEDPAVTEEEAAEEPVEDVAEEAEEDAVAEEEIATPDPVAPTTLDEMSQEQILAGLPPEILALFPDQVDPEAGQQLVLTTGCTACHSMQEGVVQVGPSWYNMGNVAVTRVEGESPALYLYNSIVHPNDYVVEGFLPNLMPAVYDSLLTDEQIADMIAYLLTLRGE
jgi:mono/diheme cytochrome c family protein